MPAKRPRKHKHFWPSLDKRFVATCDGYEVYTVNAFAVRNYAQPDEEFDNFATQEEFTNLIPKDEIWLAHKTFDSEGVLFLANALTRLKEQQRGATSDRAYDAGLQAERALREKHNGVRFRDGRPHRRVPAEIYARPYLTLPDVEFPVHVWLIDGNLVRSWYKTDYTEGGHGYVYRWVPKDQIWIEKDLYVAEMPFIVVHEYLELRLMRDRGIHYDRAHAICSKVEFDVRKGRGIKPRLAPGPRRLKKPDLHRLTRDDVFRYVTAHCVDR